MHKIILISGKQGSGKSTLADGLEKVAREYGYLPVRTRFAKILYEMHDAAVAVAKRYGIPAGPKEGEMLQWLGTEWGRNLKGENVWVNAVKTYIEEKAVLRDDDPTDPFGLRPLCFIIDDMRFVNEFEAFSGTKLMTNGTKLSALKIRLEADKEIRKARCSYWRENDQHPSETSLDHLIDIETGGGFDQIINSGCINSDEVLDFVVEEAFK